MTPDMHSADAEGDRVRLPEASPRPISGDRSSSSFDAIRLVAAFAVLVSHQFLLAGRHEPQVRGFGSLGVLALSVFFVISGYFVASSWDREPDLLPYWRKRVLRIFPALLIVVAISILIIGPTETSLSLKSYATHPETWAYWKNALLVLGVQFDLPGVFASNTLSAVNLSLWTLPIEIVMYATIAISGITLGRFARWSYPILSVALAIVWLVTPDNTFGTLPLILSLGVFFLAGATVYSFDLLKRVTPVVLLASTVTVVLASVHGGPQGKILLWVLFPLVILGLGAVPSSIGRRVVTAGDFSYGVYLWAFPIQQIVITHSLRTVGFWISMLFAAIATAAMAFASWHFVEQPALQRKSRGGMRPQATPER